MLDLSNIPNSQENIKIFQANGNTWQTWQKPRKCNYVWIMCIGSGAGGGNSVGGSVAVSGGSGGITKGLFNAQLLPDTLYVQVGVGGLGAPASNVLTSGSTGSRSVVGLTTTVVASSLIMASGNIAATAGGAGESTTLSNSTANFIMLSNYDTIAGQSNLGTGNITAFTSTVVSAGAGTPTVGNGYSVIGNSFSPTIVGGTAVASGTGGNGADGITSWKPFYSLGGAGGGSSLLGQGGNGGKGGIGSGGGGGGAGTTLSGKGGDGGDGLVIIVAF